MVGVRRTVMAVTLTVTLTGVAVAAGAGTAVADPSPAQVRAKLVKLNERADQLVERYNQATEKHKAARKTYEALDAELAAKSTEADALRRDLVTAAVNDYRFGTSLSWQRLIGQGSPEAVLGSMASLEQLAAVRAAKIQAFEAASKDLRERRDDAEDALAAAQDARDKARKEKAKVDELVEEQTKILRRLGTLKTGDRNSTGVKYTGPASGNAREALRFAFAQVGKPYQYGATGPGSFDCSGLTQAAWRAAGVQLPRTTYTQWSWGASRRVPLSQVQPGDLLFSRGLGHMGMYAGDGKMVHAPQTGDVVKIVNLDDYWRNRLLGAIRP